jgi:hypothetical protein
LAVYVDLTLKNGSERPEAGVEVPTPLGVVHTEPPT